MKVAEVKLRCRNFPNRRKFCDIMLAIWILLAIFWIWHSIALQDIVYLISAFIAAIFGTITILYPVVEVYENGIRFGERFYRWFELKAYRKGDYVILRDRKGVTIPLPASKLSSRAKRLLQELVDDA